MNRSTWFALRAAITCCRVRRFRGVGAGERIGLLTPPSGRSGSPHPFYGVSRTGRVFRDTAAQLLDAEMRQRPLMVGEGLPGDLGVEPQRQPFQLRQCLQPPYARVADARPRPRTPSVFD